VRAARRLLTILLLLVVVAVMAVAGLLGVVSARALPQTTGLLQVAGLHGSVTVIRDRAGIAQIYADDPHDLFMAQGYVHAQDRLWQMEVWRHISSGRLSELFGESTIDTDRFVRTLDWRGSAVVDYEAAADDVKAAMGAYADGVNAYIDGHAGSLGLPFVVEGLQAGLGGGLGGYTPEPWTPLDSMAWQKVQAFNLGGNMDAEIFRLLADERLGDPARTDELFPAYDPGRPVITPTGLEGSGGAGATAAAATAAATTAASDTTTAVAALTPALTEAQAAGWRAVAGLRTAILSAAGLDAGDGLASDHGIGSNNWVVAPSKSATSTALLANDPHLGFNMPSVWFMNGLHCRTVSEACPFDVVGVSFPGAPAVVLGHNARIAWGATNVGPDVMDLFQETLDPADPDAYLFKGQSMKFETRTETIEVAGADPVTMTIRSTRHGPILNDVDPRLADAPPVALSWTTLLEPDGAFESLYRLNTASNFDEFRAAFQTWGAPSQNFVYADVDGHIGYQLPGEIPIRAGETTGDRVRDGASGEQEWTGWIPFDDLPWQYDPPSGLIVTANNAAVDPKYPYYIAADWDRGERAQRILDLVTAAAADGGGVTPAEISAIQNDTYLLRADGIVPGLLDLASPTTDDGRLLRDRIAAWNRFCDVDSKGCAAYVPVELQVVRRIFDDELGPLAREWVGSGESGQVLDRLLGDPASPWWDDTTTPGRETAKGIVSAAFDDVGIELRAAYGDPSRWTWGRIHQVTFREATLGLSGIGPLEWYFNADPRPAPGAAGSIDNNYYQVDRGYDDPYDDADTPVGLADLFSVTNGPSYRLVVDMGDLDGATIVTTTGQSGNPFDRHYGDLIDSWLSGTTVPLPFSPGAVEDAAAATLTLTP
jgi:penicillin amidase